jgi:hypothetical protein
VADTFYTKEPYYTHTCERESEREREREREREEIWNLQKRPCRRDHKPQWFPSLQSIVRKCTNCKNSAYNYFISTKDKVSVKNECKIEAKLLKVHHPNIALEAGPTYESHLGVLSA